MSEQFAQALALFAVGMITIFGMLALVVGSGNLLIQLVNRFFPGARPLKPSPSPKPDQISPAMIAAIVSTVEWATAGKGHISSIQRMDKQS